MAKTKIFDGLLTYGQKFVVLDLDRDFHVERDIWNLQITVSVTGYVFKKAWRRRVNEQIDVTKCDISYTFDQYLLSEIPYFSKNLDFNADIFEQLKNHLETNDALKEAMIRNMLSRNNGERRIEEGTWDRYSSESDFWNKLCLQQLHEELPQPEGLKDCIKPLY